MPCVCVCVCVQRHNAIRDWLEAWIARFTGRPTDTEEYVVAWNRPAVDAADQPVWEKAAEGRTASRAGFWWTCRATQWTRTGTG